MLAFWMALMTSGQTAVTLSDAKSGIGLSLL